MVEEIKYDIPFEVTKNQYIALIRELSGFISHRENNGKYYVKTWFPKSIKHIIYNIIRNEK